VAHPKGEVDKPAVLTLKVQREIIKFVREGNYLETAYLAAGTTKWTVEYWRKLYEAGAEHAQKYADFFTSLARASALAEAESLSDVRSGRAGWQGPAWFLDRRFRSRWNAKQTTDSEGLENETLLDEDGNTLNP
jgi:hypothetical protein